MKTLAFQQQSEVFERVVRDARGRAFCVRFVIVEREGILRGRILSCVPISSLSPFSKGGDRLERGCFLEGKTAESDFQAAQKISSIILSPYFHNFDFLTAIKIRAPSFHN